MPETLSPPRLQELWSTLELTLNRPLPQDNLAEAFSVLDARIAQLKELASEELEFDQYHLEQYMLMALRSELLELLRIRKPGFTVQ